MINILALFEWVVGLADPVMAVWIVVVMVLGYWLKRTGDLPKWLPPLPVLLFGALLAVGLFFGLITNEEEGWKGVGYVVAYAFGNALLYTGVSFIIYDIAHAFFKKRAEKKSADKEAA